MAQEDVDRVFKAIGEKRVKDTYVRYFGSLDFKTVTAGKDNGITGQLALTLPDRVFSMDEENAEMLLMMVRDLLTIIVGSVDCANMLIPLIHQLVTEGGRMAMQMAEDCQGEQGEEGEQGDPCGPRADPDLN